MLRARAVYQRVRVIVVSHPFYEHSVPLGMARRGASPPRLVVVVFDVSSTFGETFRHRFHNVPENRDLSDRKTLLNLQAFSRLW